MRAPTQRTEVFLGTDQPETCRYCGARATIEAEGKGWAVCSCPQCASRWRVEFEFEFEENKTRLP